MSQNLSSAAVVIGALRVNCMFGHYVPLYEPVSEILVFNCLHAG